MGEINTWDEFGRTIIRTVKEYKLESILEIGSWDGTGSTQCFIEALRNQPNPSLVCIELREERFSQLVANTREFGWIECKNTTTISSKSLSAETFDDIWTSRFNKIKNCNKDEAYSWYKSDLELVRKCNAGFLETNNKCFDGVLIDGGEFFGYAEYRLIKNRTNVIFLDDYYSAYKTNRAARELLEDPDWTVVAGNRFWRNGYAVFRRNNFITWKR